MGSKVVLLLVLMQLIFTEHSQGVLETKKQSLIVSGSAEASVVGKHLNTPIQIHAPRQRHRLCNCTGHSGKGGEVVATVCPCQWLDRHGKRNGRGKRLATFCQKSKNQNVKKCRGFLRATRGKPRKLSPSVPI